MNTSNLLGLGDNPVITGLWQVADLERDGTTLDREQSASLLLDYMADGFTCMDMADHYGSAELIAGAAREKANSENQHFAPAIRLYTKWCPQPHECTLAAVRSGIEQRLKCLGTNQIDLLQLHWWNFDHPGYIDVMDHLSRLQDEGIIHHLGVTNFDTDHLQVLLACGFRVVSNQVCVSVLDQRAMGDMSTLCEQNGVRLLAYGTLAGGFLSERWLDKPEPAEVSDWSKMKYLRFIHAVGGWQVFQRTLKTLQTIATRHQVSISNVATRWVLEQPAVAGVIIGARLTEKQHRLSNKQLLSFELGEADKQLLAHHSQSLTTITGDCGTEYRRPPYLTASGDLSHHLESLPPVYSQQPVPDFTNRWRTSSGSEYEPICGYSRAIRSGNRILVSGTTATHGENRVIGTNNVRAQTVYILDKISASITSLGGTLDDVIRTRVYLKNANDWETVSRVHGRYFGHTMPANTLLEISNLVGDYAVEIEAEAELNCHPSTQ